MARHKNYQINYFLWSLFLSSKFVQDEIETNEKLFIY